jgi:hypothetical protein
MAVVAQPRIQTTIMNATARIAAMAIDLLLSLPDAARFSLPT